MRAMRAEQFSGYEALKLVELPKPTVTEGKVLVRITAAGVTPLDHTILFGRCEELPWIRHAIRKAVAYVDGDGGSGVADCVGECSDAADGAECGAAAGVFCAAGVGSGARRVAAATADGEFDPGNGGGCAGVGLRRDGDAVAGSMGADRVQPCAG